jgi:hypothetical protein
MALHSKECFAVMSSDSDFLIFPQLPRFIPFESLHYKVNGKTECHVYTPKRTANCLGINLNLLPLFSCMIGFIVLIIFNSVGQNEIQHHFFSLLRLGIFQCCISFCPTLLNFYFLYFFLFFLFIFIF